MKLLLLTPLALMACAHEERLCYIVRPSPDVFLATEPCTPSASDRAHSSPPPATSPGNPEPTPPAEDGDSSEGNGDGSD